MAQLVLHFGWTWVGTIAADDDYGKYGIKDFKEEVEEAGVCISFSETLPKVISLCLLVSSILFYFASTVAIALFNCHYSQFSHITQSHLCLF